MRLDKNLLVVDYSYQRTASKAKVNEIAKNFSWPAFGVILASLRSNGRYYVFDGQHRVLGARKRDDVQDVPCIVFVFDKLSEEAQAYVRANTVRGAVSTVEKFKGRLVANDPDAVEMEAIATRHGMVIPDKKQTGANILGCVAALETVYGRGIDHCNRVLSCMKELCEGEPINGNLMKALSIVDLHLQRTNGESLDRRDIQEKLIALGPAVLIRRMAGFAEVYGKSGDRVWAASLVNEINKGKRSRRIKPIIGE